MDAPLALCVCVCLCVCMCLHTDISSEIISSPTNYPRMIIIGNLLIIPVALHRNYDFYVYIYLLIIIFVIRLLRKLYIENRPKKMQNVRQTDKCVKMNE